MCAYLQHCGTGTWYATVCQNLLPYLYPCYPFWKHCGFFRTCAKPYSCSNSLCITLQKWVHINWHAPYSLWGVRRLLREVGAYHALPYSHPKLSHWSSVFNWGWSNAVRGAWRNANGVGKKGLEGVVDHAGSVVCGGERISPHPKPSCQGSVFNWEWLNMVRGAWWNANGVGKRGLERVVDHTGLIACEGGGNLYPTQNWVASAQFWAGDG